MQKVAREENVADILTKIVNSEVLENHVAEMEVHQDNEVRDG